MSPEIIMNPSQPEEASPGEVTEALGTYVSKVSSSSHEQVRKLDELDQERARSGNAASVEGSWGDVNRALSNLKERADVLSNSLVGQEDLIKLAELKDALENNTEGMIKVMPTVATSKQLLSKMIIRYGQGLQLAMDQKGYLSPEIKQELKKLDSEVRFITED